MVIKCTFYSWSIWITNHKHLPYSSSCKNPSVITPKKSDQHYRTWISDKNHHLISCSTNCPLSSPWFHCKISFQLMHKWLWKNYFFTCTCNIKIFWVYPRQVCKKHGKIVDLVLVLPGWGKSTRSSSYKYEKYYSLHSSILNETRVSLGETSSVLPFGRINACCVYTVQNGKALTPVKTTAQKPWNWTTSQPSHGNGKGTGISQAKLPIHQKTELLLLWSTKKWAFNHQYFIFLPAMCP